jgi:putative FmdB family regulatory protein
MPTYEYGCTNGHTFEVEQRITEDPLKTCTMCKAKVQRLLSAPRFILKGGGWYADGYSGSGSGSGSKGDGAKSESSSKSESTKSDSKGSDKKGDPSPAGSSSTTSAA